jgi:hypothetical protein
VVLIDKTADMGRMGRLFPGSRERSGGEKDGGCKESVEYIDFGRVRPDETIGRDSGSERKLESRFRLGEEDALKRLGASSP